MFLYQDSRFQNACASTGRTARRLAVKGVQLSAVVVAGIGSASAAIPAGVSTALGDAASDAGSIGGLALVAVVAAVAFKYARRAL